MYVRLPRVDGLQYIVYQLANVVIFTGHVHLHLYMLMVKLAVDFHSLRIMIEL